MPVCVFRTSVNHGRVASLIDRPGVRLVDLSELQIRLHKHFAQLRRDRDAVTLNQPVFALEHGLTNEERQELSSTIRAHVRRAPPGREHSLPWIVYATELGYSYAGDEYWQTFEAQTPGWRQLGTRDWIRQCFYSFHESYGGAMPTGAWAQHFSIICWPITHALLPCDLQRQLAQLLYEIRHLFSSELISSPKLLGDLIAGRSWSASSRFQQLTQEPLFLGQIAGALLLEGSGLTPSLIYPDTLLRIRSDLDRERHSRIWLEGARESATHRLSFSSALGRRPRDSSTERTPPLSSEHAPSHFEPRMFLRPDQQGSWTVVLEFSEMSGAIRRLPHLRDVLAKSTCLVAGAPNRPIARSRFLFSSQKIDLTNWPGAGVTLLKFERSTSDVDALIAAECLIRPGPLWLFKVAADGLAYGLRKAIVRAGQRYIILHQEVDRVSLPANCTPLRINCEGIKAFGLNMPEATDHALEASLTSLGIQQLGTVQVWPVGLCPAQWDGQGQAEWLSTDTPCIGIRSDHHVDRFELAIEDEALTVHPQSPGVPLFVELPQLPVGGYHLIIQAVANDRVIEATALQITIREPRVWIAGSGTEGAFCVIVDPVTPTLEQLWDGSMSLQAYGPPHCRLYCDVEVIGGDSASPILERSLPPIPLPVSASQWSHHFDTHFRRQADAQNSYDLAQSIRLRFKTDEFGTNILLAERQFYPLRWIVQRNHDALSLWFQDDTGSDRPVEVTRFEFNAPDVAIPLNAAQFEQASDQTLSPGLYVAKSGQYRHSIVLPVTVRTFEDLQITPRTQFYSRTPEDIQRIVDVADYWASARVTGGVFSVSMRLGVVRSITRSIFLIIAGSRWKPTEYAMADSKPLNEVLLTVQDQEEVNLARAIDLSQFNRVKSTPRELAQYFATLAESHLAIPEDTSTSASNAHNSLLWASEFAIRLASGSKQIEVWGTGFLLAGIEYVLSVPSLAKAARVFVYAMNQANHSSAHADVNELWEWR